MIARGSDNGDTTMVLQKWCDMLSFIIVTKLEGKTRKRKYCVKRQVMHNATATSTHLERVNENMTALK